MPTNIFSDTPLYGALAWITVVYVVFVATLPWAGDPRGVWKRAGIGLLILGALSASLILQCRVGYCGHGAMILVPLLALAGIAALLTLASAALARRWRK